MNDESEAQRAVLRVLANKDMAQIRLLLRANV